MRNTVAYKMLYRLHKITIYQLDRLLNYRIEKRKFYQKKGYKLDLLKPQSFCEKVIWKKINDRNPLLPLTADKYLVRDYIRTVLGEDKAEEILVPILCVVDDPSTIPFKELHGSYIVKPNHMSGAYIVVNGNHPDYEQIVGKCKKWLVKPYGIEKHEWAYKNIKRKILIEKLLLDANGEIPDDYKFFMFHGKCHLIQHCYDRLSEDGVKIGLYKANWEYLNVTYKEKQGLRKPMPPNLQEMIEFAEALSKPFDFVRVDFYSFKGKTHIGELTHYPGSGKNKIDPVEFDFELGSYWKIQPEYWLKL